MEKILKNLTAEEIKIVSRLRFSEELAMFLLSIDLKNAMTLLKFLDDGVFMVCKIAALMKVEYIIQLKFLEALTTEELSFFPDDYFKVSMTEINNVIDKRVTYSELRENKHFELRTLIKETLLYPLHSYDEEELFQQLMISNVEKVQKCIKKIKVDGRSKEVTMYRFIMTHLNTCDISNLCMMYGFVDESTYIVACFHAVDNDRSDDASILQCISSEIVTFSGEREEFKLFKPLKI